MTSFRDKLYTALCTSGGLGFAPVASGTIGSIPAVLIYIVTAFLFPHYVTHVMLFFLVLSCLLCVLLGDWAEKFWKTKDPKFFVLDEYAGYFLTVLLFRVDSILMTAVWTFVMTRVFDILKPPPARRLEYLRTGWGILVDDLIASVYASGALHVLLIYFPVLFTKS